MTTIINADCLQAMREMPDNSVDAVISDPPYGLSNTTPEHVLEALTAWISGDREYTPRISGGFMGSSWDAFVPPPAVWDEAKRVLKPGGNLAVFAGTRTVDLMGLSMRLAGMDVRDSLLWVHSQGFPKGKGQLKPSHEPILLARKPFKGSAKANVEEWGTGALNIDSCRINVADKDKTPFKYCAKAPKRERPNVDGVQHPTVKPLSLLRWLLALTVPPGGVVLDPFAGSGTTVEAALLEGFNPVGIEAHKPYIPLIRQRVARAEQGQAALNIA